MGAQQSLTAGYACVSGDLPEVDKQHSVARPSLQKQRARQNDDAKKSKPSHSSQQIGCKLSSHIEDEEVGEPGPDMNEETAFFIASFSGTDKDRQMVAEAMRAAMTQALDGSRVPARAVEASLGLQAQIDLPETPPSATLQAAALALEKAVCLHDAALVRQLVHAEGALVDQLSQEGVTALHVATAQGLPNMISALVLLDANIDAKTLASGDTALHICAQAGGLNEAARSECLAMLIGLGASLDLPNKDGRFPLHVAAMSKNLKAVQTLVAAGARRGVPDKDGRSPADVAEACGAHEIFDYLSDLDRQVQVSKIKQYEQWL